MGKVCVLDYDNAMIITRRLKYFSFVTFRVILAYICFIWQGKRW